MFRFMIQKLTHKKWMVLCLLIGNILLVAVAVSCPLYKNASLQRMLTDEFSNYLYDNNDDPGMITLYGSIDKKEGVKEYTKIRELSHTITSDLGITPDANCPYIAYEFLNTSTAVPLFERTDEDFDRKIAISAMNEMDQHINLISGRTPSATITDDGYIEVMVSTYTFTKNKLMIGDEFKFKNQKDADKNPYLVRVVGVFENDENEDGYWVRSSDGFGSSMFMDSDLFNSLFVDTDNHSFQVTTYWYVRYDYTKIDPDRVGTMAKKLTKLQTEYKDFYSNVTAGGLGEVLNRYTSSSKKITVTLLILQVPVLVLLCAFLYLISDQMLQMERNEISLLKSRGASRMQILLMYVIQSLILAAVGLVVGTVAGAVLCRAIGSASAFLEFVNRRNLKLSFNREVLYYALAAMGVSMCMTVLPVIGYSRVTIVNLKRSKSRSQKPFWQKFYLDILLLAVGCYGYFSFHNRTSELLAQVLGGDSIDPLLYVSSSVFILGAGMTAIRLQPIIIKVIYMIGAKFWRPAAYASFLQTLRTGARQNFMMIFLVLTIALGIFNATVARTILSNAEANTKYIAGTDLIVRERWDSNAMYVNLYGGELTYSEPDFGKYTELDEVSSATKVYHYDDATMNGKIIDTTSTLAGKYKSVTVNVDLLGINTKEYGTVAKLDDSLLDYDYYDYLNVLSTNSGAAICSSSMHDMFGYNVGDNITVNEGDKSVTLTIYGFVSYWPGFVPTNTTVNPDGSVSMGDNFLIVTHFSTLREQIGERPYEIWMDVKDSALENDGTDFFYDWAEENDLVFEKFVDCRANVQKIRNDTMFQGTNGILTMSFIIILVLCVVGFLIYWILSIRSRELLFGVFRAMGMTKNEIISMLINEQLFSSIPAILLGTGVGFLSAYLFVPLLQIAYATQDQILPLEITTSGSDLRKLFIIILMMFLVCALVLVRMVYKMKVSQALKLGED